MNQSDLSQFAPRVGYILLPIGMLTMSTADETFTIKSFFSEKESAGKDTNNVNNKGYATRLPSRQCKQEKELVIIINKIHGITFLTTTTDFSRIVLLQ